MYCTYYAGYLRPPEENPMAIKLEILLKVSDYISWSIKVSVPIYQSGRVDEKPNKSILTTFSLVPLSSVATFYRSKQAWSFPAM